MKKIMLLLLTIFLVGCSNNAIDVMGNVSGYYEGSIDISGTALPLSLELVAEKDLTGFIDIAVQNAYDLQIEEVDYDEDEIKFSIQLGESRGYFAGIIEEGNYHGEFIQNGIIYPFEFIKTDRPDLTGVEGFEYGINGLTIEGELMVPGSEEPYPVALIIAGSGMTDMNGNSNSGVFTNSYKYIAETLQDNGIASLRYNKRTIGNPVVESELSFDDFVADAVGIVESLKRDPRFSEVYLIGHSQGALIAQLVTKETEVSKVVLVAGAGRPIDEVLLSQMEGQVEENTYNELFDILKQNKMGTIVEEIPEELYALIRPSVQPFLISWMQYDPFEVITSMENEILVISGSTDIQVPVSDGEKLAQGNAKASQVILDGMTHVLKEASSDQEENIKTYQNINLPLHEGFVDALIDFFNQ